MPVLQVLVMYVQSLLPHSHTEADPAMVPPDRQGELKQQALGDHTDKC
jgi:hypothetical protein